MTPGSAEPRCAVHADVAAVGPCTRCGTFACATCLADLEARLCASCVTRLGPTAELPEWERREPGASFAGAFFRTVRDVLKRPIHFFTGVRTGTSLLAPLAFAMLAEVLSGLARLLSTIASTLAGGGDSAAVAKLALDALRWAAVFLALVPVRLLVGVLVLTLFGFLAGVEAWPLRRTARMLAYLHAVEVPLALFPTLPAPVTLLIAAGWGTVAFAAVHQAPLRRAIGAFALMSGAVTFCFVGLYQLFSAR